MSKKLTTKQQLLTENAELRARLEQTETTLREILSGDADALFVSSANGAQLFTLKGADKVYRTLIEEMNEGALTITAEGLILYANRHFAEMLKMPLEKVIGATINRWVAPESESNFRSLLNNGTVKKRSKQLDIVASDGTLLSVFVSVNKLFINEIPDAFSLVVTNLTEQKHDAAIIASEKSTRELLAAANLSRRALLSVVEDQKWSEEKVHKLNLELEQKVIARTADLERSRLEAELANHTKSDFLAAMSHEIRTPMNGVIGMIDVLQQSSLTPQQIEMIGIIHDSAFALLAVIDDILDFSKIEAGRLKVESLPMNIADVVEGACDVLDQMAQRKSVELMMFVEPSLPALLMGDPGRLRQILINLTNNAIKFSSGQGGQARVSVRVVQVKTVGDDLSVGRDSEPESANQVAVEFIISDNGIGIDAATQIRLFTPFTQADTSTTRNFGGTGLGLVISRQLANMMGGTISVQSEADKGAVFTVRLMLQKADRASAPQLRQEPSRYTELKPNILAGLCCLVLGGAESQASDMAAYLAYDGAQVDVVAEIEAARQWIGNHSPGRCIVIIDSEGAPAPQTELLLDDLRTAASTQTGLDLRFVIIGRGKRRQYRVEAPGVVSLDAEVMHRKAFLAAVAITAERIKQHVHHQSSKVKRLPLPPSRDEARQQGRLILVAEDNEINQKVIYQQLSLLGQTADITDNGRKALKLWQSGDYSMLITDLHMPEMDGYELTEVIRASKADKSHIPIIAFTANALKGEAEHCLVVGMDDYLSKPVQLVNLKAVLEKWLPLTDIHSHHIETTVGTNPSLQHSQPVDVRVLKALVGDDAATIADFLHDFRISTESIATELRTAYNSGNRAGIVAAAHKLKSSARSVGALALGELCAELEQAGKDEQTSELATLVSHFEMEISAVDSYLDSLSMHLPLKKTGR